MIKFLIALVPYMVFGVIVLVGQHYLTEWLFDWDTIDERSELIGWFMGFTAAMFLNNIWEAAIAFAAEVCKVKGWKQ